MKKIITAILTCCYLGSYSFAGTMFVQPGDRATSMGGAFTGVADDATAIYYNPAGLTQLDGNGVEFTSCYLDSKAKNTKSLQNNYPLTGKDEFPLYKGYPTEPSTYNNKNLTVNAFLPFVAGYTKLNDINLAVGVYAIGGGTGKWSDAVKCNSLVPGSTIQDDLYASINRQYSFIVTNFSGAKKISDKVAVGVGLNVLYMQDTTELKKGYASNSAPAYSYDVDIKRDGDGYGFEAEGGVLYRPIEKVRLGLTLRSGSTIKISGTAKYNQISTNYTQNYEYPLTYALGLAYDATDRLLLAFSADIADYSTMKDNYTYDNTQITDALGNPVFVNTNSKSGWHDTTMLSVGAKYKLNEYFDLMGGIRRDPAPYPQEQANLLNTEQYNLTTFTLGTEYKINSFNIGLSIAKNISDTVKRDGSDYEFPSYSFRFGVKYKF